MLAGSPRLRPCLLRLLFLPTTVAVSLGKFVPLELVGFGKYASSPALFLTDRIGSGLVLPVPVPLDAVMAIEQALSPTPTATLDVLLHARGISQRNYGVFDALPWEWSEQPQAKRFAADRFTGRGYPRDGYQSPYDLLLDCVRRDCCAEVAHVLVENTAVLGGLVLGGALLLERRETIDEPVVRSMGAGAPAAEDARWRTGSRASVEDMALCECYADEALGLALALGAVVHVEAAVWEAAARPARYTTQREKMRLDVQPADGAAASERAAAAEAEAEAVLPWEIGSLDELDALGREGRARSALAAGLRLPRAREASAARLEELLEPLLDETVRRALRIRRALASGDGAEAAALSAAASRRGQLLEALRAAVADERFGRAAELAIELRTETARRADVTQDEGAYDRFLDQDDWYAQQLAREREQMLQEKRVEQAAAEARAQAEAQAEAAAAAEAGRQAAARRSDVARAGEPAAEAVDGEWTAALEAATLRQMIAAFDNVPADEVAQLLRALVRAAASGDGAAERSLQKLALLTRRLEALGTRGGGAATAREAPMAQDEARTLRAQLRMWGKDGEKYVEGSWLHWLDSIRPS